MSQLKDELQRHHQLPVVEGFEEHDLAEPLKLRSQYWELELDTTTGGNICLTAYRMLKLMWHLLVCSILAQHRCRMYLLAYLSFEYLACLTLK